MISGQWFYTIIEEDFLRIGQKLHKITPNSMKNRGSIPILTNLVRVHLSITNTKFEANLCSGSREEVKNGILHIEIHCEYICYITNQNLISIFRWK